MDGMTPRNADDDLISRKEATRMLGITERTLDRYIERGLLVPVRLPSGQRRFRAIDVANLLDQRAAS